MIVLYLGLALLFGFVADFLVCWISVRSTIDKLEALFERYKLVDGEWTRPDDPTRKLPEAGTGGDRAGYGAAPDMNPPA
jgi:hypothetical protein